MLKSLILILFANLYVCACRKRRSVIIIRVNNFKKPYIAVFLNLSNCSFHFIIYFNRVSILTYPLIRIHDKIKLAIIITNKPLLPNCCWIVLYPVFYAIPCYSVISRFSPIICSRESFFPANIFAI